MRMISLQVYIYLEDINDNPPQFNQREYVTTIFETIPISTEVLQVFASDRDIGINAQLAFSKVPNSGDPDGKGVNKLYCIML